VSNIHFLFNVYVLWQHRDYRVDVLNWVFQAKLRKHLCAVLVEILKQRIDETHLERISRPQRLTPRVTGLALFKWH
jgi:hypothetical protein